MLISADVFSTVRIKPAHLCPVSHRSVYMFVRLSRAGKKSSPGGNEGALHDGRLCFAGSAMSRFGHVNGKAV